MWSGLKEKKPREQTEDPWTTVTGWSALFLITEREISVIITVFGGCKKLKNKTHYPLCLLHYKGSKKGGKNIEIQGVFADEIIWWSHSWKPPTPAQLRSSSIWMTPPLPSCPYPPPVFSFCVTQAGLVLFAFKSSSCLSLLCSCSHTLTRCHADPVYCIANLVPPTWNIHVLKSCNCQWVDMVMMWISIETKRMSLH